MYQLAVVYHNVCTHQYNKKHWSYKGSNHTIFYWKPAPVIIEAKGLGIEVENMLNSEMI